jgi:hypothetical protein
MDGLDTLHIAGLTEEVTEAEEWLAKHFDVGNGRVSECEVGTGRQPRPLVGPAPVQRPGLFPLFVDGDPLVPGSRLRLSPWLRDSAPERELLWPDHTRARTPGAQAHPCTSRSARPRDDLLHQRERRPYSLVPCLQGNVNLFEMTIRVIGGLLSAYELRGSPVFLQRAKEVADAIIIAFDT